MVRDAGIEIILVARHVGLERDARRHIVAKTSFAFDRFVAGTGSSISLSGKTAFHQTSEDRIVMPLIQTARLGVPPRSCADIKNVRDLAPGSVERLLNALRTPRDRSGRA